MKIVFSSNISWSIYNFRLSLLKSMICDGHECIAVANKDEYTIRIVENGIKFHEISFNNNAKNPFYDLKLIYDYYKLYKLINPDVICHNAIKPNIYGSIAARFLGIPVVNNISGLGTLFIKKSVSTMVAKKLYKISQKKVMPVFFQNSYDLNLFLDEGLIRSNQCELIHGSGVNLNRFKPKNNMETEVSKPFVFLFIGRLLNDKGIREYVDASKILSKLYDDIVLKVLGPIYENNETAITKKDVENWHNSNIIHYLGESDQVEEHLSKADCVVLPSYREGLSKVLIEACSMAKPIVTTNVPGCNDVVIDGLNGFLCSVKNSVDLARKMEDIYLLDSDKRNKMGLEGRHRAETIFDENLIIDQYKKAIYKLIVC